MIDDNLRGIYKIFIINRLILFYFCVLYYGILLNDYNIIIVKMNFFFLKKKKNKNK